MCWIVSNFITQYHIIVVGVESLAYSTFWHFVDGIDYGFWNAHFLDTDICWVEKYLRNSKSLICESEYLLSSFILPCEIHLLSRL